MKFRFVQSWPILVVILIAGWCRPAHAMLNPTLGRFMQEDPLGYMDGKSLYQYVRSNPIMHRDERGLAVPMAAATTTCTYTGGYRVEETESLGTLTAITHVVYGTPQYTKVTHKCYCEMTCKYNNRCHSPAPGKEVMVDQYTDTTQEEAKDVLASSGASLVSYILEQYNNHTLGEGDEDSFLNIPREALTDHMSEATVDEIIAENPGLLQAFSIAKETRAQKFEASCAAKCAK